MKDFLIPKLKRKLMKMISGSSGMSIDHLKVIASSFSISLRIKKEEKPFGIHQPMF